MKHARRFGSSTAEACASSGTIAWNVVEGVVAVGAGIISGSSALVGFGAESSIEICPRGRPMVKRVKLADLLREFGIA